MELIRTGCPPNSGKGVEYNIVESRDCYFYNGHALDD